MEREILEKTYYDICDIYRISEEEDEDGITNEKREKIAENIKCSLSQKTKNALIVTNTQNNLKSTHTLFLSDIYEIKESDIIYIKNKDIYLRAGEIFTYPKSHTEIAVETIKRG